MIFTNTILSARHGDITLGWTDDQVELMTAIIERKMQEGYTFFFLDDDHREVRLRTLADLAGRNRVVIGDQEAELLIRQGKIGIVDVSAMISDDSEPIATKGRAKSAAAAARGRTVATAAKSGG